MGKKNRKIDSARERARTIPNTTPFHRLRIELDQDAQDMLSVLRDESVRLVHDGQRWPSADEPIDEQTVVLALQRGKNKEARRIVGRYLRETRTIALRVQAYLADMIDPPENCAYPFIFQFEKHSDEIYKLNRYAEIGRHCRALHNRRGGNLKEAVYQTKIDLGVSVRDVYRGLRVIAGKSPDATNGQTKGFSRGLNEVLEHRGRKRAKNSP